MLRGRGAVSPAERVEMEADNGRGMGTGWGVARNVAPAKRTTSAAESRKLCAIMRKQ